MTKAEVLIALSEGKKVTHQYFTDDEWMIETDGFYKFEDGVVCHIDEFWTIRTLEGWEDGWNIYENNPTILPSYP